MCQPVPPWPNYLTSFWYQTKYRETSPLPHYNHTWKISALMSHYSCHTTHFWAVNKVSLPRWCIFSHMCHWLAFFVSVLDVARILTSTLSRVICSSEFFYLFEYDFFYFLFFWERFRLNFLDTTLHFPLMLALGYNCNGKSRLNIILDMTLQSLSWYRFKNHPEHIR